MFVWEVSRDIEGVAYLNELHTPTKARGMPTGRKRKKLLGYEPFAEGRKARLHQTEQPNAMPVSERCPGQRRGVV
jgi:hypothetical protein